ncbi:MAG: stage II sporulation protein R [Ruminococcus sp.]|nr:stage II sporulation protein R [Ruminococcus sp.]
MKQTKKLIFIEAAAIIGLVITIAISGIETFAEDYHDITENVFRLHILANSDSEADQALKLKVRDEILSETSFIFENNKDFDTAIAAAREYLPEIEAVASRVIRENGYDYAVKASIEAVDFDTRVYGEITMPAGTYTALRVEIGEAAGRNWWCVMFPPLCLPAVAADDEAIQVFNGVLTPAEQDILKNPRKYEAKFYVVEIFQRIKAYFTKG